MITISSVLLAGTGVCIGLSVFFVLLTMLRNRNMFTRLVCMEVLSNVFVIAIGVFALEKHLFFLLNVAIVVSLLIFLGTLAFCSLLEKRDSHHA